MSTTVIRPRLIRDVWIAVFGDDPTVGTLTAEDQHRVVCPFHAESNASCDVSIGKNAFICRSCGAQGGALDVVVQAGEASSRAEAAKWLEANGVALC